MTLNDLYEKIEKEKPGLIYLSGKTCVGKSTFANLLHSSLNYEIVELDTIVIESVIKPLKISDQKTAFVEIYKKAEDPRLVEPFIAEVDRLILKKQRENQPIVLDGAIASASLLLRVFDDYAPVFVCIHPKSTSNYRRNLTSRFMQTTKQFHAGLPKRFWDYIDEKDFQTFCDTRQMTRQLEHSIEQYALSSQKESAQRLATFQKAFPAIIAVEI